MIGSIEIEGKSWSFEHLDDLSNELTSSDLDWKISTGEFLKDWIGDDDHVMVHTSGSTGKRKSIILQKDMMRRSAKITAGYFNLPPRSSALLCLSANYIAGMMMIVRAVVNNWNLVVVEPNSNPLKNIAGSFDFCAMVPLQVQSSLDHSQAKLTGIKTLIIGGAVINSDQIAQLKNLGVKSFATYGMTETATHIAIRELSPKTAESFVVMSEYTISQDSRGCLIIDAEHLEKPVQTNDSIQLTSTGFELLGRLDNVINSGGIKVFPEEIESKIAGVFDGISFYVTSSIDDKLGEKIILVIEGEEISGRDILMECSEKLVPHQKPRQLVYELDFERTETGKIIRKRLP